MNEIKDAYKRLGLPEDISREDLNKRFDLLLKKRKSGSLAEEEVEEEIRAYRLILDYWRNEDIREAENKRLAKWGKLAGPVRKTEDFFRKYKTHTLITLIAVVVLTAGLMTYLNHREEQKRLAALPPVDLSIVFLGNYRAHDMNGETEALEQAILEAFPEWKRVEAKITYLPPSEGGGGGMDFAYMQKAVVELATERPDLYIMDDASFEWLSPQEGLENLDDRIASMKVGLTEDLLKKARTESDTEDHVYGIDIGKGPDVKNWPLDYSGLIAGVRADAEHHDKAIQFIERFVSEAK
ncbi:molecular chaperone DnaJ [Paenibacillus sp. CN-4]|uniref:molecular chaperone DnaJ n=1 Tax=Paenibacillus nanchangensis TaxID=3348343 RepID=UPI00397823ED